MTRSISNIASIVLVGVRRSQGLLVSALREIYTLGSLM